MSSEDPSESQRMMGMSGKINLFVNNRWNWNQCLINFIRWNRFCFVFGLNLGPLLQPAERLSKRNPQIEQYYKFLFHSTRSIFTGQPRYNVPDDPKNVYSPQEIDFRKREMAKYKGFVKEQAEAKIKYFKHLDGEDRKPEEYDVSDQKWVIQIYC